MYSGHSAYLFRVYHSPSKRWITLTKSILFSVPGLRVASQFGNFYDNAAGDLTFGTLDADKAVCVSFTHNGTLDERQYAFLQSAVLYTTADGKRRVRTINLALQVVTLAGNVFRFADLDTTVSYLLRESQLLCICFSMCVTDKLNSGIQAVESEDCIPAGRTDGKVLLYSAGIPKELCCRNCTLASKCPLSRFLQAAYLTFVLADNPGSVQSVTGIYASHDEE